MDALAQEVQAKSEPGAAAVIACESWDSLWPDARPLMLAHRAELGQDDPRCPLVPDQAFIRQLQAAGGLLLVTARDTEHQLLGYSIWYLVPSLETVGLKMAMQAPWYVVPAWRGERLGWKLWVRAKSELAAAGVRLLHLHAPAEGPEAASVDKFWRGLGATRLGTEYALWLEPA